MICHIETERVLFYIHFYAQILFLFFIQQYVSIALEQ